MLKTVKVNIGKKPHFYFPEVVLFIFLFLAYLYPRLKNPDIASYAGLYMEIVEAIIQNHFSLPLTLPYYGPGGIPFAYPPFGFYLSTIVIKILDISILQYARYAPVFFYTAALVVMYFLVLEITRSRFTSIFSVFLYGTSNVSYIYHAQESGMIRGLALLFTFGSLLTLLRTFTYQKRIWPIIIAIMCITGIALTHWNYLLFFVVSIPILIIIKGNYLRNIKIVVLIGCSAMILCAPWLYKVISTHGIEPFLNASSTHGNLLSIFSGFSLNNLLGTTIGIFQEWDICIFIFAMSSFFYLLLRKQLLFPVWFVSILILVGEPSRFLLLISTILIALAILDAVQVENQAGIKDKRITKAVEFVIVCVIFIYSGTKFSKMIMDISSVDVSSMNSLAEWFRLNTSEDTTYLLTTYSFDYSYNENMPYFIKRTPVICPWGGEWAGSYKSQIAKAVSLNECVQQESSHCVLADLKEWNLSPDYIIIYQEQTQLQRGLWDSLEWHQVFKNNKFIVFAKP